MDAADKAAKSESKSNSRRKAIMEEATPHAKAQERWAKSEKSRKQKNPVVETYWELVAGRKLVLCKKTANGSVHRTFIGSTDDKQAGTEIKAKIASLQKDPGMLRVRV